jgi:hypothetical protein
MAYYYNLCNPCLEDLFPIWLKEEREEALFLQNIRG